MFSVLLMFILITLGMQVTINRDVMEPAKICFRRIQIL